MAVTLKMGWRLLSLLLLIATVSLATFVALLFGQLGERHFSWGLVLQLYGMYAAGMLHGDLGETDRGEPVRILILRTFFKSFGVLGLALGAACLVGVGVGVLSQWRRGSAAARWPLVFSMLLLSAPSFLIGGLMQYVDVELAVRLGTVPLPTTGFGWDRHLIMPVLVLAAKPAAYLVRITGQVLEEAMRQDYVRTAYAKGLVKELVVLRHGLRTSGAGILAGLALAMRLSVGMLPIVEMVFVYPGMGFAFLLAVRNHDTQAAAGLAMAIALTLWLLNAGLDVVRRWLDPRLSSLGQGVEGR